jgi:hypothetical protein
LEARRSSIGEMALLVTKKKMMPKAMEMGSAGRAFLKIERSSSVHARPYRASNASKSTRNHDD